MKVDLNATARSKAKARAPNICLTVFVEPAQMSSYHMYASRDHWPLEQFLETDNYGERMFRSQQIGKYNAL